MFRYGEIPLCKGYTYLIILFAVVLNYRVISNWKYVLLAVVQIGIWSFVATRIHIKGGIHAIKILSVVFVLHFALLNSAHLLDQSLLFEWGLSLEISRLPDLKLNAEVNPAVVREESHID